MSGEWRCDIAGRGWTFWIREVNATLGWASPSEPTYIDRIAGSVVPLQSGKGFWGSPIRLAFPTLEEAKRAVEEHLLAVEVEEVLRGK